MSAEADPRNAYHCEQFIQLTLKDSRCYTPHLLHNPIPCPAPTHKPNLPPSLPFLRTQAKPRLHQISESSRRRVRPAPPAPSIRIYSPWSATCNTSTPIHNLPTTPPSIHTYGHIGLHQISKSTRHRWSTTSSLATIGHGSRPAATLSR